MATLDGVHAKLGRAERHIRLATRLIKRFARTQCRIVREPNPATGEVAAILRIPPPDPTISLVIGDAIHNLRAALDHTVYQLVLSNSERPADTPNDRTMFPIADTAEGFRRQADGLGRLRGVRAEPAAIIDRLQPYHRRRPDRDYRTYHLWTLNKLENIDKHRRMTLTSGVSFRSHATIADARTGEGIAEHCRAEMMRDGTTLFTIGPLRPGQEVDVRGAVLSFVAFDEPSAGLVDTDAAYVCRQILEFVRDHVIQPLAPFIA